MAETPIGGIHPTAHISSPRISPQPRRPDEAEKPPEPASSRGVNGVSRWVVDGGPEEERSLDPIPVSLLRDTKWQQTEWAWRRLVFGQSGHTGATVEALRHLLDTVVRQTGAKAGDLYWRSETVPKRMLSFRELSYSDLTGQSADAVRSVLADRFLSAMVNPDGMRAGSGLFFPETTVVKPLRGLKWEARRWSKLGPDGRMVHRMCLECTLSEELLKIWLTSCKPSLTVHIECETERTKSKLADGKGFLTEMLQSLGWDLERWSVSHTMETSEGDTP